MGSITKRLKLSPGLNVKECEDRITNLPCSLIGHILSFLPTKYAVATSVLSTAWKHSWTLINCLDFDDRLLLHPGNMDSTTLCKISFTCSVSQVLLLRGVSCLPKVRVDCCQTNNVLHVNAWVAAMLMYHIQELEFSIPMEHSPYVQTRDIFSCRTLVVLKLGTQFDLDVPNSVCLPSLKTLHLDTVKLVDSDSIKRLLIGCPVLEELSMMGCIGNDIHVIHICALVLKKLKIDAMPYDCLNTTDFFTYKIVLDTPALLHLEYSDIVAKGYVITKLSHLIKASIILVAPLNAPLNDFWPIHSKAITDLLTAISKVQCLYLSGCGMEGIHESNCQLPMFHDATCLEFGEPEDFVRWALLPELLNNSPRLETLIFEEGIAGDDYPHGIPLHPYLPQFGLPCSLLHLKTIEIWTFEGKEEELEMVKYLLKNNAKVFGEVYHIL